MSGPLLRKMTHFHIRQTEKASAKWWQSVNPVQRGALSGREGVEVQREVSVVGDIWGTNYTLSNYWLQCISWYSIFAVQQRATFEKKKKQKKTTDNFRRSFHDCYLSPGGVWFTFSSCFLPIVSAPLELLAPENVDVLMFEKPCLRNAAILGLAQVCGSLCSPGFNAVSISLTLDLAQTFGCSFASYCSPIPAFPFGEFMNLISQNIH